MRSGAWAVLIVVLLLALAYGSAPRVASPSTPAERVDHIAGEIRCPTCAGLSVAESSSMLAQSSKKEIEDQVAAGRSDAQIRDYFVSRYGESALLSPDRHGLTGVAWFIPIAAGAAALFGIAHAVRRWRAGSRDNGPSPEDRRLVEQALGGNP